MEIDRVIFPVNTLGIGNRVGIWTYGCPRRCYNCSNPELQNSNKSKEINVENIIEALIPYRHKIEGITITGGDPFFQQEELDKLISLIYEKISKDIIVFSGYTIEELRDMRSMWVNNVLSKITILIDGEYVDELNDGKGLRGSTNQQVHILNDEYAHLYKDCHLWERKVQNIFYKNNTMHVGIPIKHKIIKNDERGRAIE